ncbi:MAG: site-specific tyrosine recombinase XerC [Candidatus Thiodiazotropha sp. (ex Lucinoma kastoroae)]|nr:site-specific tyrosine recombinase XerC [Candidatus Thiodiazotropha sp. (ex Lucinoma kastoroae)]
MVRRYEHQAVIEASGFYPYLQAFLEWTQVKGQSKDTLKRRQAALRRFIHWCDERDLKTPQEITKPILERYQRHLYHYRKSDGRPLSHGSQCGMLTPLKAFFKWLTRENHILYNPASELELPKKLRGLPKAILSQAELETVFNQPDLKTAAGIRDRAILELFYSTGMRRMELVNLKTHDLDINRCLVMIRQGKYGKDRFIPVGERALQWLEKYQNEVRPELVTGKDEGTLFLTDQGEAFRRNALAGRVKRYLQQAGIEVVGSCHLFRHAMATHMLGNGADVRIIQMILGHEDLNTMQIYTRVSIKKLAEIHAATHPTGREREAKRDTDELPGSAE